MAKMLRRVRSDEVVYGRDYNRLMDTVLGNSGGRFKLWGDDGDELSLIDGTVVSSNNYPMDIRSDNGTHERIRHSTDSHDVWEVLDAGVTLEGTFDAMGDVTITGDVAVTGNQTVSGTLTVTGATTLGALTVGGVATFNANATFNVNVTLGDDSGDTITINGTTTANANVTLAGSSVLTLPNGAANAPSLVVGDAGGLFRQAAGVLGFSTGGAERARLSSTGLLMAAATPITLANNTGLQLTESGGVVRVSAWMDTSNLTIFGHSGNSGTVVRGGGVRLQYGTTTKLEINSDGVAFNGESPASPPSLPADASDITSNNTLTNAIKDLLIDVGLAT